MRNNVLFYIQSIQKLVPNEGFNIDGTDYSTLKFTNELISKPQEDDINIEYDIIETEFNNKEYQRKRQNEYPDFKDYLDGVVKGDQEQIQKYIDDCLAVKQKYPKPL
jgi:hypothetical protein